MAIFTMNAGEWKTAADIEQELDANYIAPVPEEAGTVNIPNGIIDVNLLPATPLLALTINFPTIPYNGQPIVISTIESITSLTINATVGVIHDLITTLAAGVSVEYKYIASTGIWVRKR